MLTKAENAASRLTDAQAEMAGEHWEKAMQLARIHAKKYPQFDLDWESVASVALCEVAMRFDPAFAVKFWTFASRRVNGSLIDAMRAARIKGYGRARKFQDVPIVHSLDGSPHIDHRDSHKRFSWHEVIPSDEHPVGWATHSIEAVEGIARCLPWQEREVLILLYCYGFLVQQVGRVLGLSHSRVSQIHRQAIERLRQVFPARESLAV